MAEINLPPILVIKRNKFENAFKIIIRKMLSENKIEPDELRDLNREIKDWLVTGMQTVDFEKSFQNNAILDDLIDDLWKDFYRDLNLEIRKYRTKFRRKPF